MSITDFTQLDVWNKAMDLAQNIHEITKTFPASELYGMTSQMRRASVSVGANIAEGFGRYTYPDKMHKYVQARGELIEVMTFLHHAYRISYINMEQKNQLLAQCADVHKMLNALISRMASLID